MSLPREGSRVIREGIIVSVPMDWCKSPSAIVPYKIYTHHQVDGANNANSVRQTDAVSHVKESLILKCFGDEPGVGGGCISGTHNAECEPKTWSETVRFEDRNAVRHDDLWWMNHKNTWGRLDYSKDTNKYAGPPEAKTQYAFLDAPWSPTPAPEAPPSSPTTPGPSPTTPAPTVPTTPSSPTPPEIPSGPSRDGIAKRATTAVLGAAGVVTGAVAAGLLLLMTTPAGEGSDRREGVRTTGKRRRRCDCIVGSYNSIKHLCGVVCGSTYQAHHIVADYTLRFGNREEAERNQKRIPGLPKFGEGPAICLQGRSTKEGSEHSIAHGADPKIALLGSGKSDPQGTTAIHNITTESIIHANRASKGKCAAKISKEIAKHPNLYSTILGRTTIDPPVGGSTQYNTLMNGTRATLH